MQILRVAVVIGCLQLSCLVQADELSESMNAACENLRSCALEQLNVEDIDEKTKEMMRPMFDNLCKQIEAQYGQMAKAHGLYEPVAACFNSMAQLSCDALMDNQKNRTEECQALEALAQDQQ